MQFDWKTFFKESIQKNITPIWIDGELVCDIYFNKPYVVRGSLMGLTLTSLSGEVRHIGKWNEPEYIHLVPEDVKRFLELDINEKGEVMTKYYQDKDTEVIPEGNVFKVKLDPKINPLKELEISRVKLDKIAEIDVVITAVHKINKDDIKINCFKINKFNIHESYFDINSVCDIQNATIYAKNRQDAELIQGYVSLTEYNVSLAIHDKNTLHQFGNIKYKSKFDIDNSISFYYETCYSVDVPNKKVIPNVHDPLVIYNSREDIVTSDEFCESMNDEFCVCGFDVRAFQPTQIFQPTFSSGAKTDDIKPAYNLIPLDVLKREAKAWKVGSDHYGENNWQKAKGDDQFIKERANHLIEHIFLWLSGDRDEDHLANVRCNAGILMELTKDEK